MIARGYKPVRVDAPRSLNRGSASDLAPLHDDLRVDPPSITGVSPNMAPAGVGSAGPAGTQVVITGSNFGTKSANDHVGFFSFNSGGYDWYTYNDSYIVSWSNTQITCYVPADASSKDVAVVKGDVWSNKPTFSVPWSQWLRWKDQSAMPLGYYVNVSAISGVSGALAATQASLQTWEDVPGDYLDHSYPGTTTRNGSNHNDGYNDIAWSSSWTFDPSYIAVTTVRQYNGVVAEADTQLNAQYFAWSATGEAGKMDVQNIVTHEAGHGWVGLADLYGTADSPKTMYGYAQTGETYKRDLAAEDIAGCQWEYANAYCPGWATEYGEYIARVQVGAIDNPTSYTPGGYVNYTSLSTTMSIGTAYTLTVTNGYPYAGDRCGAWGDWNQDGDFSDSGESISMVNGPTTFNGSITPPAGALAGNTRLRIRVLYDPNSPSHVYPCGEASFGEVEDYTVDVHPVPASPANPTVIQQNCGNTVIQRTGNPPAGVTWFWQGTNCGTSTSYGSGPTYTCTTSGTYYIRARDDSTLVWSTGCGSVAVTVITAPNVPTGVTATNGTLCDKVQVNWTPVSGATLYKVYRGMTDTPCPGSPIGTTAAPPFDDLSATPGLTYYYSVKASNGTCDSTCSLTAQGMRALTPSAPTGVTATKGTLCDKVQVNWTPVSGATLYKVYRGTTDTPCPGSPIGTPAAPPFDDLNATPGVTYWYSVKASGACDSGCSATDSGYSTGALSSAPVNVAPSDTASCLAASVCLDWGDVTGATSYDVYWGTLNPPPFWQNVAASTACPPNQDGTTYYWYVLGRNVCGPGPAGTLWSYSIAPAILPAPTLQTPVDNATCQGVSGTLDWSDVASAAGYRVQIGASCGYGTEYDVTASQYSYAGLSAGATYYWRVKTKNTCGTYGSYSSCFSFTTDPGALGAPTLLTPINGATCQGTSGTLDWSDVANAAQYQVQLGISCGTGTESGVIASQYAYSGLLANTTYYWRVKTKNTCGTYGDYSDCFAFTTANTLGTPNNMSPPDGSTCQPTSICLEWSDVSGATSYDVYWGTSNPPPLWQNTATSSACPPNQDGATYYWYIRAKDNCGVGSPGPTWSYSTGVGPGAPNNQGPNDGANCQPTSTCLDWSDISGATSYDVYWGTASSPPFWQNVVSSDACPPNQDDTTYYWYVRAKNACGSTPGPTWSYTTGSAPTGIPANSAPGDGAACQATNVCLDWADVASATSYDVYWGAASPPPFWQNVVSSSACPPNQDGTTYYWYIRAKDACGTGSPGPTWSYSTGSAPATMPTNLSPANGAESEETTVCLDWSDVPGATSYDVYWGTATPPTFWQNVVESTACPPNQVESTYYWFIMPRNPCGSGPAGPVWSYSTHSSTVNILGHVHTCAGTPLASVTLSFTNQNTATTNPDGSYTKSVPYGWTGTATPCADGWRFEPPEREYGNPVHQTQAAQDYVGRLIYDVDAPACGDDYVGVGDLSRFAVSWLQAVPPADPEHDFDCDAFVGVGDLSFLATAWLKPVFDPTIAFPPCRLCGRGERGSGPWADNSDIRLHLVAVAAPGPGDFRRELPPSPHSVRVGDTYYIELWARDAAAAAPGLTSVYADILTPAGQVAVTNASASDAFNVFTSGVIEENRVSALGGSTLAPAVGTGGYWARAATIEVYARAAGRVRFDLRQSGTGIAAYGLGAVPWQRVHLHGVDVVHAASGVFPVEPDSESGDEPQLRLP